ncbi:hypothetical protein [Flavobacterium sp. GCM10023249]|uniref:hypothetical protein n=1 Tax=unclassified Flavobacterium TaxID=196869 RepID=UPI0036112C95
MKKYLLPIVLIFFIAQNLAAQGFNKTHYLSLIKVDKNEFVTYAESVGMITEMDEISETLFARTKGCVFGKPLGTKNNNASYDLVLLVSTLDKSNNKLILDKAKEIPEKKGTWIDDEYLYIEWDMENPNTKEMWYKILVYKRKK